LRLDDAVGVEQEPVASLQADGLRGHDPLTIQDAEGVRALAADLAHGAAAYQQRIQVTAVRPGERARLRTPAADDRGDETAHGEIVDRAVHLTRASLRVSTVAAGRAQRADAHRR